MNLQKKQLVILLSFLIFPVVIFSQFTYLDISVGNKFMKISKQKHSYTNRYNQTNIHVNGLWRFTRQFGIGATASIPIRQGGKYNIQAEDHNTISKIDMEHYGIPLDYFFRESAKFSINGRIYAGIKRNFYVDGRISMFSFTENLTVNAKSLEKNTFKQVAPGFSIGMQPHLSEKLFMNLNMSFDFYKFKDIGFKNGNKLNNPDTYGIPVYTNMVYFKSQVPEKKMAFSANLGFGYFF